MKKLLLLLLFCFLLSALSFAQNLVPNPAFEDYTACPNGFMEINEAINWSSYRLSPDYFNTCATTSSDVSIPYNGFGFQYPPSTNCHAYIGIYTNAGANECAGAELLQPLQIGQKYYVSFKVCLSQLSVNATNNIGIKFSNKAFSISNPVPINNISHVYSSLVITDTANWTKITGVYVADSNYKYIMIANFFDDAHTNIIYLTSDSSNNAYYYIDDICVSTDSAYCYNYSYSCGNGITNFEESNIDVFPNSVEDKLNININNNSLDLKQAIITIYNSTGMVVGVFKNISTDNSIDLSGYSSGLYFLNIQFNNKSYSRKIIKQ